MTDDKFEPVPVEKARGEEGHVQSKDVSVTADPPVGVWTDVRVGQVTAQGCYTDPDGVLRSVGDDSVVAWHWKPRACQRRGLKPEELVYHPETNAPWCPECWPYEKQWEESEKRRARRQRHKEQRQQSKRISGITGMKRKGK